MDEEISVIGSREVIRSVLRAWPWIIGAAVFAVAVVGLSWLSSPEVFRTTLELRIVPPPPQDASTGGDGTDSTVGTEGKGVIGVVMSGEVKEAVGLKGGMAQRYGLDTADPRWFESWSRIWDQRVRVAGPTHDVVFLLVDDEDGDRGAAFAEAILEALKDEWVRRDEVRREKMARELDRLIEDETAELALIEERYAGKAGMSEQPQSLVLAAESYLVARDLAALRIRRRRLDDLSLDGEWPWVVVGRAKAFEYRIRKTFRLPIVLSAVLLVLLVGVGRVAYDLSRPGV